MCSVLQRPSAARAPGGAAAALPPAACAGMLPAAQPVCTDTGGCSLGSKHNTSVLIEGPMPSPDQ